MSDAPLRAQRSVLRLLLVSLAVALVVILLPFYGTLLWALVIGLLFAPLQHWLQHRLGDRPTLAALLTLALVVLIVVLPILLISVGLVNEVATLMAQIKTGQLQPELLLQQFFAQLPDAVLRLLDRFGIADVQSLQRRLVAEINEAGQFIAARLLRYGQNTFALVASLFVMLYVSFFLLRDGAALVALLHRSVPLTTLHQRLLARRFSTAVRATVKGNLLVALLQGALGGLAFWMLDVRGALVWAVLMAFLSLLPAVGAALVWGPVALSLLVNGQIGAGLGLLAWGMLVIGLVDNLLRPLLVGKDTRMPDWVVLMTTLGGMAVFGINGFVLGPVIAAMFFAVWQIFLLDWRRQDTAENTSTAGTADAKATPASDKPPDNLDHRRADS